MTSMIRNAYKKNVFLIFAIPDLIKTSGEENETILFQVRVQLFRYIVEFKRWKELGAGIMKVLNNKFNSNRARFMMRHEKIENEILCDHRITKNNMFIRMNSETIIWIQITGLKRDGNTVAKKFLLPNFWHPIWLWSFHYCWCCSSKYYNR